jgi:tetratricopeptide (TPR) repeat protein
MDSRAPAVEDLLKLAKEDIARSRVTSAEKTLEQAILMNNQVPEAFYLLGQVYSKAGKFKKSILAFRKALNLDPFFTDAAIALSSLYNDVGKYREGAHVFNAAKKRLERTPPGHDPRINEKLAKKHYELGLLYMQFERFLEANHEFTKAFNLEPTSVNTAVQMAKCLSKSGDKAAAIALLRKTLETHPKSVESKIQLGILYHSLRRLPDAHREWQEALSMDPDNKSAQMYLGMFDYEPGLGAS